MDYRWSIFSKWHLVIQHNNKLTDSNIHYFIYVTTADGPQKVGGPQNVGFLKN